jgi:hypothetical protein
LSKWKSCGRHPLSIEDHQKNIVKSNGGKRDLNPIAPFNRSMLARDGRSQSEKETDAVHITWGASVSFAAINGVGIAGRRFRRGFVEKRDGQ